MLGHCLTLASVGTVPGGTVRPSRSLLPPSQDLAGGCCRWGLLQYKYLPLWVANHAHSWSVSTFHQVLFTERVTEAPKRTVYPTNTQQALAVDQHVCGLLPFISLMLPSTLGATWRN